LRRQQERRGDDGLERITHPRGANQRNPRNVVAPGGVVGGFAQVGQVWVPACVGGLKMGVGHYKKGRSFLKKRTKKLLILKGISPTGAYANGQKFLLLFSKRRPSLRLSRNSVI
jgi:hypothetical protein